MLVLDILVGHRKGSQLDKLFAERKMCRVSLSLLTILFAIHFVAQEELNRNVPRLSRERKEPVAGGKAGRETSSRRREASSDPEELKWILSRVTPLLSIFAGMNDRYFRIEAFLFIIQ